MMNLRNTVIYSFLLISFSQLSAIDSFARKTIITTGTNLNVYKWVCRKRRGRKSCQLKDTGCNIKKKGTVITGIRKSTSGKMWVIKVPKRMPRKCGKIGYINGTYVKRYQKNSDSNHDSSTIKSTKSTVSEAASKAKILYTQGTEVRLRAKPRKKKSKTKCYLDKNVKVISSKRYRDRSGDYWHAVTVDDNRSKCNNRSGYVHDSLLDKQKSGLNEEMIRTLYTKGTDVVIRKNPSTDADRVCVIQDLNTRVTAGATQGKWIPIEVKDRTSNCNKESGYIYAALLDPSKSNTSDDDGDSSSSPSDPVGDSDVITEMKYLAQVSSKRPSRFILKRNRDRGRSYRSRIRELRKNLFRTPKVTGARTEGVCGSYHYNPDGGRAWTDAYIHRKIGCGFVAILQEWNLRYCQNPKNKGCRIAFGDISDIRRRIFSGHRTHTNGLCVDLRPMKKKWNYSALTVSSSNYSRSTTEKFVRFLRRRGATIVILNDRALIRKGLTTWAGGHHNHLHVCFSVSKLRKLCRNFRVDRGACPNLAAGRVE